MNPFEQPPPTVPQERAPRAAHAAHAAEARIDDEPEFHLTDYLEKLRRHWKLIALTAVLGLAGAAILYAMTPKQYQATARLQIERRSLSPVGGADNPWLENYLNFDYYPTQYELLQSRGLAERVVVDLGLADDPAFGGGEAVLARTEDGSIDPETADAAVLGRLAGRLLGGLQVTPVKGTQLVDISYRSSSPRFAARVANGFADAFIDWGITTRTTTAGRASSFLASQIDTLKQELQDKETELQAVSRQTDIVSIDPESNVVLQRLHALNQDYIQAKAARIEAEARYQEMAGAPAEDVADEYSNGNIAQVRQELNALEREYQTKLQTYKPEWPAMIELSAEIEEGRRNLERTVTEYVGNARRSAQVEYQTALRKERTIEEELAGVRSDLLDQGSAAVELTNLQVEIATSRDLMDKLLRQQSETEVAARLQTTRESNVRVVDRALVPGGAFRPSLRENLTMGLGLGLMMGIGFVFLIEYMDRTLKTPEEVERRLMLPNLAVIPDVSAGGRGGRGGAYGYGHGYGYGLRKRKRGGGFDSDAAKEPGGSLETIELLPHQRPRLSVSEAYRALRTALLLSTAAELKVVSLTSAGPGEGKSATSTNLAVVMAQLGKRVLLIDGDLRKPRLHEVFGISNRSGLTNVLAAGEDPNRVTASCAVSNLLVIPSGPIPPNPSELLSSNRMHEFLRRARAQFDFVIIDTPPVLAVTDATVIGSLSDGVVLCLRAGKVLREDARTCRDRLLMNDVKILGTVLNRHREGRSGGRQSSYYEAYIADEGETAA